jgi:hypothetical protein
MLAKRAMPGNHGVAADVLRYRREASTVGFLPMDARDADLQNFRQRAYRNASRRIVGRHRP